MSKYRETSCISTLLLIVFIAGKSAEGGWAGPPAGDEPGEGGRGKAGGYRLMQPYVGTFQEVGNKWVLSYDQSSRGEAQPKKEVIFYAQTM